MNNSFHSARSSLPLNFMSKNSLIFLLVTGLVTFLAIWKINHTMIWSENNGFYIILVLMNYLLYIWEMLYVVPPNYTNYYNGCSYQVILKL